MTPQKIRKIVVPSSFPDELGGKTPKFWKQRERYLGTFNVPYMKTFLKGDKMAYTVTFLVILRSELDRQLENQS